MTQTVIENPIINSPFVEPTRHFRFADEGITNEIVDSRRTSSYFVPIASPKKKKGAGQQLAFDTEWTQDRIEENKLVNDIRRRVAMWRKGGYVGVTPTTARLIAYWTDPNREKKLFFCQNEALETAIYSTEVAKKYNDAWIENTIREANDTSNPGLPRMAFKMATGSGKTVVMAMIIAWHTLNKRANPQDARFSDTFLIITLKDNTFPQLLLLIEFAHDAADRIYQAIVASTDGTAALKPILSPYDTLGSTRYVDFDTTRAGKCQISHVVADTDSWEQKLAAALEEMSEVARYVKNNNLGFATPYTLNGEEKNYIPDFVGCIDDGHGPADLLNLIVEVTGEKKKDKAAKVATACTLWVPAVNNHGGFGRWAFIEIDDPWNAKNLIRSGRESV